MEFEWNVDLFRWINDFGKTYDFINPVSVFVAEYTAYILLMVVILFWFTRIRENRVMIMSAGIAFILAEVVGKLCGLFYFNAQPFAELSNVTKLIEKSVGNSFPSDHTILFFTFCFSFFLFHKRFRYLWMLLACMVAISRILVGVHYPLDVFVGACIGMLMAFVCYYFIPNNVYCKQLLEFYEKIEGKIVPSKNERKKND